MDLPSILRRSPLSHEFLVKGRVAYSVPRYWYQYLMGRFGYLRHGSRHDQNLVFVAGLPKSGTSWVEGMLASFAGFQKIMPPRAVIHEVRAGGSHGLELTEGLLAGLQRGLHVLKLHTHGSSKNAMLLRERGLRYAVVYRDPRDVAISHYFYVRRTPWHPEHVQYRDLSVQEGIDHFADTLLEPFAAWIEGWHEYADAELARFVRYEDLLSDALGELTKLVEHFGIGTDRSEIEQVQKVYSFERVSGGRERGQSDDESFVRKGVQGDWRNWFTNEQDARYREEAGGALQVGGYL